VVQRQPRKTVGKTLSQKYSTRKRAGGVDQVLEHLLSKREALSSNHNTTKYIHTYIHTYINGSRKNGTNNS
jgi:hypothetical protein